MLTLPVITALLVVLTILAFLASLLIPRFWEDSDESPLQGLPRRAARIGQIALVLLVIFLAAYFYLGNQYQRLQQQQEKAAPTDTPIPTPVIHISSGDAQTIIDNFNQMCNDLLVGEKQAVFDDLTPRFQQQLGTADKVLTMISGQFKGGNYRVSNCSPDDQQCGNLLSGDFADFLASPDVDHAQLCAQFLADAVVGGLVPYNVRSFSYVRTNAGWKIDGVQTLSQGGGG